MVCPSDKEEKWRSIRNRSFGVLFSFSVGSLFNLLPFLDFKDFSNISLAQWVFLSVDLLVLLISAAIYLYFTAKIYLIGRSIEKRPLIGS
jgi:general stress protein CsbA